jgi:hypothetical protein
MPTFVVDSFTAADDATLQSRAGEVGATWAKYPGYAADAAVTSNRLRGPGAGAGVYAVYTASGAPASADYDVQATIRLVISGGHSWVLIGRAATAVSAGQDTFYWLEYGFAAETFRLFKAVAGAYTLLGDYAQTLAAETDYAVKLQMRGSAIKAFVGGVEQISAVDSGVTAAGRAGLGFSGTGPGTGWHMDDFAAADAPASGRLNVSYYLGMN